jgi:hypothetical protein
MFTQILKGMLKYRIEFNGKQRNKYYTRPKGKR